jgi:hypothetical protein
MKSQICGDISDRYDADTIGIESLIMPSFFLGVISPEIVRQRHIRQEIANQCGITRDARSGHLHGSQSKSSRNGSRLTAKTHCARKSGIQTRRN